MPNLVYVPVIPDSSLAKEATDILREHSTDLLFNHSIRVYLFATEQGRRRKLRFDAARHCKAVISRSQNQTTVVASTVHSFKVNLFNHRCHRLEEKLGP